MTDPVGILRIRKDPRGYWAQVAVDGKVWAWAGPFDKYEDAERELDGFREDAASAALEVQREQ